MNMIATQTLAGGRCNDTYDPGTGVALLPCIDVHDGSRYDVVLQHTNGLKFNVVRAHKYEKISLDEDSSFRTQIIMPSEPANIPWLFIEVTTPDRACDKYSSSFSLTSFPDRQKNNPGRIDIKLFAMNCFVNGIGFASFGDALATREPGIYEIYINGEFKEAVEIPNIDSKNQ